jgi:hypothetical protein
VLHYDGQHGDTKVIRPLTTHILQRTFLKVLPLQVDSYVQHCATAVLQQSRWVSGPKAAALQTSVTVSTPIHAQQSRYSTSPVPTHYTKNVSNLAASLITSATFRQSCSVSKSQVLRNPCQPLSIHMAVVCGSMVHAYNTEHFHMSPAIIETMSQTCSAVHMAWHRHGIVMAHSTRSLSHRCTTCAGDLQKASLLRKQACQASAAHMLPTMCLAACKTASQSEPSHNTACQAPTRSDGQQQVLLANFVVSVTEVRCRSIITQPQHMHTP